MCDGWFIAPFNVIVPLATGFLTGESGFGDGAVFLAGSEFADAASPRGFVPTLTIRFTGS